MVHVLMGERTSGGKEGRKFQAARMRHTNEPEHDRLEINVCGGDSLRVITSCVSPETVHLFKTLSKKGRREEVASVESQTLLNILTKGRLLNPPTSHSNVTLQCTKSLLASVSTHTSSGLDFRGAVTLGQTHSAFLQDQLGSVCDLRRPPELQ